MSLFVRRALGTITALVLVACSGSEVASGPDPEPTAEQTSTIEPDPAGTTPPTSPKPAPTKTAPKTYNKLAGGPTVRVFPPGDDAYEAVASVTRCREMFDKTEAWPRAADDDSDGIGVSEADYLTYHGAAAACLGRWETARADAAALNDLPSEPGDCSTDPDCCARLEVQAWTQGLLDGQQQDPAYEPVFVDNPNNSDCPTGPSPQETN